jgi:hypothetical protein
MRRRSLLASAGTSIAALAGCFEPGDETDPPTEQQPIDETSTLSTTTEAPEVTVESVIQQYGYATANDDAIHVARTGTQYVVAAVTVEGGHLERADFTWTVDDSSHSPTTLDLAYRTSWGEDQWYEGGRERGLLTFQMPESIAPSTVKLVWPTGEWVASDSFLDRLAAEKTVYEYVDVRFQRIGRHDRQDGRNPGDERG